MKPIYKLSPSTIGLMIECPRCFWLTIVKGEKRPGGAFPSLPSGMDHVLKEHFDRFMETGDFPPELREQECMKNCALFKDGEKLKVWRNNFKGIQYYDEKSGILLRGAVDNILTKGKKLIVLDYKTRGYPVKEDTHEHYQHQMNLYTYLLQKNGYETENYAYLLFYYPNKVLRTGEVIFDTQLVRITVSAREGERLFKKAVEILNRKEPPEAGGKCEYCRYRKQIS